MKYNSLIHHRRSIRLKGYDYSQAGAYFITICTKHKQCLFGHITDGEMILNEMGQIAFNEWLKTPELRPNVSLDVFVIMPNHMHGIILIKDIRRGELNSPNLQGNTGTRLHSPNLQGNTGTELNSPNLQGNTGTRLHSPNLQGNTSTELNSPNEQCNTGTGLHSPNELQLNSPPESPLILSGNLGVESGSPYNIRGEFNSPLRSPSKNVGAIVRGYKSSVTKQINLLNFGESVWQRNYHEHIIRSAQSYQRISDYVIDNPKNWNKDKFFK